MTLAPDTERPSPRPGVFVVLEGLDRTGKSTMARELAKLCERDGIKARLQAFPGRTIDQYLKKEIELDDNEVHQLFSTNRWECAESILSDLASGTWVITDRYAFSGAAYSMAKGLDMAACLRPDEGLPRPHVVFYLTASPAALAQRGGYGEERYERVEFQTRVKAEFERVAEAFRGAHGAFRWRAYETEGTRPGELAGELYAVAREMAGRAGTAAADGAAEAEAEAHGAGGKRAAAVPPLWVKEDGLQSR